MTEQCSSCRYVRTRLGLNRHGAEGLHLRCHRWPPQWAASTGTDFMGHVSTAVHAAWPEVQPAGWCGEYKRTSPDSERPDA